MQLHTRPILFIIVSRQCGSNSQPCGCSKMDLYWSKRQNHAFVSGCMEGQEQENGWVNVRSWMHIHTWLTGSPDHNLPFMVGVVVRFMSNDLSPCSVGWDSSCIRITCLDMKFILIRVLSNIFNPMIQCGQIKLQSIEVLGHNWRGPDFNLFTKIVIESREHRLWWMDDLTDNFEWSIADGGVLLYVDDPSFYVASCKSFHCVVGSFSLDGLNFSFIYWGGIVLDGVGRSIACVSL